MIQELKIRNFKSFRDEAELSFEPSGEDSYNSVVTMPDGVQLLRFAVVLGANASGKSNLLDAVEFLRTFWNNIPAAKNDEPSLPVTAHGESRKGLPGSPLCLSLKSPDKGILPRRCGWNLKAQLQSGGGQVVSG